jgi:hypothetical protein
MSLLKLVPAWLHGIGDYGAGIALLIVPLLVGGSDEAVYTGVVPRRHPRDPRSVRARLQRQPHRSVGLLHRRRRGRDRAEPRHELPGSAHRCLRGPLASRERSVGPRRRSHRQQAADEHRRAASCDLKRRSVAPSDGAAPVAPGAAAGVTNRRCVRRRSTGCGKCCTVGG